MVKNQDGYGTKYVGFMKHVKSSSRRKRRPHSHSWFEQRKGKIELDDGDNHYFNFVLGFDMLFDQLTLLGLEETRTIMLSNDDDRVTAINEFIKRLQMQNEY